MSYKYPFNQTVAPDVESVLVKAEEAVTSIIQPVRKSFFRRFPTFSLLLTTTGVTATFLGIEQILLQITLFKAHPSLLLLLGIGILVMMGTLYKKLS